MNAELKQLTAVTEKAVARAKAAGAAAADAILEAGIEFRGDVLEGKVENLKRAQRRGLGLRVIVDQRVAIVYTSDLREAAIDDLAQRAVALARQSTPDDFAALPEGPLHMEVDAAAIDAWDERIASMSTERKIDMAIEMDRVARGYDPRIKRTDGCAVTTQHGSMHLASSNGGSLAYQASGIFYFVNPLADDEGGRQQSGAYGIGARSIAAMDPPEAVAREAARRAIARLGARPISTRTVPVLMHREVASNWLQNVFGAFQGDGVAKKTSYLTEKLGETIASPLVTVVDDGRMKGGVASAPFDGEGQPTRKNMLIDQGVCRMFAYDDYWARRAGAKSTGNAARSYTSSPNIGHKNLHMLAGDATLEAMMRAAGNAFYLADTGAFGYNGTTGAYSYAASGFWIEKGEIAHPVQDVTVASQTLDMLKNVTHVGNDLEFRGAVNAPTLLISEMTVSGKG